MGSISDLEAGELQSLGLDDERIDARDRMERLESMYSLPAAAVARATGMSESRVRDFQRAGDRLVLLGA